MYTRCNLYQRMYSQFFPLECCDNILLLAQCGVLFCILWSHPHLPQVQEREPFRVTYLLCHSTQETSVEHLGEALQTLVAEQQDLSLRAARSTLSLHRLNQRLVVLERFFIALSRKGLSSGLGEVEGGEEGDKIVELPESKEQFVKEDGRKIKIEGRYVECVCMHVCMCVCACVCAYVRACMCVCSLVPRPPRLQFLITCSMCSVCMHVCLRTCVCRRARGSYSSHCYAMMIRVSGFIIW